MAGSSLKSLRSTSASLPATPSFSFSKSRKAPRSKIKKAEVVLKELLAEHGRQFAKVTPQYERIASSNAVILVFKIEEGPKVKVGKIKFKGTMLSVTAS